MLHHKYIRNGKPTLVMLHGLLSSLDTFIPLLPILTEHFSVLLVDQRGHGQSLPSGSDYTAEAMAYDLKKLLDHLEIKKIILLGHSMGGRTTLMFGKLYPEIVEKMIIEDMAIHQRQMRTIERDLEKNEMAKKLEINNLIFKSKEEIFKLISPLFSYADDLMKSKVVKKNDTYELKFWPHVSVLYGYQGNYTDLTSALTQTHFPVLFINADPSVGSALTQTCIEHIKAHVPRAKIHQISKSWHSIHKTHPKEFCEAIVTFANEI